MEVLMGKVAMEAAARAVEQTVATGLEAGGLAAAIEEAIVAAARVGEAAVAMVEVSWV